MDAFKEMDMLDSEMDKILGGEEERTVTYTIVNEDGSVTTVTETF